MEAQKIGCVERAAPDSTEATRTSGAMWTLVGATGSRCIDTYGS